MGPLAHAGRVPFLEPLIEDARRCGAQVRAGGARRVGPGNFFEPTVMAEVPVEARIMNEEPFGPVAMIEARDRISAPWPGDLIARLAYGVPVWTRTELIAIEGRGQVEAVDISRDGGRQRIACDGVIFTGEWVPEASLLVNAPKVTLAGNVHGTLKTSGACWREGRAIAEQVARGSA